MADALFGALAPLGVKNEADLIVALSYVMIVSGASAFVALVWFMAAPYGRYANEAAPAFGFMMNGRLAWVLQELPSFLIPAAMWLWGVWTANPRLTAFTPNTVLLGMFLYHYFNRALIFPLRIRGGKPTPFGVFLMAFVFCLWNGWVARGRSRACCASRSGRGGDRCPRPHALPHLHLPRHRGLQVPARPVAVAGRLPARHHVGAPLHHGHRRCVHRARVCVAAAAPRRTAELLVMTNRAACTPARDLLDLPPPCSLFHWHGHQPPRGRHPAEPAQAGRHAVLYPAGEWWSPSRGGACTGKHITPCGCRSAPDFLALLHRWIDPIAGRHV